MKKLITFLGNNEYIDCYYTYNDRRSSYGRFIQLALYELFCQDWGRDDEVVIFVTEQSREKNWENRYAKDGTLIRGLKDNFQQFYPQAKITPLEISDEQTEEYNWKLFDTIFETIQEKDEIYFDITHGFRSFPIMSFIILNYAGLLKDASLGKIFYGCFEALGPGYKVKEMPQVQREAPIIDLTDLVSLMAWTNGVGSFIRSGDTSLIQQLTDRTASPILRAAKGQDEESREMRKLSQHLHEFTQSMATCRGKGMHDSIARLKESLEIIKQVEIEKFRPLGALVNKIHTQISDFKGESEVMDTYTAAKWCAQHNLIQQGYTLLQENVFTAICRAKGFDDQEKERRNFVSSCINIMVQKINKKKWRWPEGGQPDDQQLAEMQAMVDFLEPYRQQLKKFDQLTQWRNNMNHAEMAQEDSISHNKFGRELQEIIRTLESFFQDMDQLAREGMTPLIRKTSHQMNMLLIFSHQLTNVQIEDARLNWHVRRFTYLPEQLQELWSNISPEGDFQEEWLKPICEWIAQQGDSSECLVHIQGEYGATVQLVAWAQCQGFTTVYSTSKRKVEKSKMQNGQVVSHRTFEHIGFREYPRLNVY